MNWYGGDNVNDLIGALVVSTISGTVSILRRAAKGHEVSFLWVISESLTAILAGYLMWTAYPGLIGIVPEWFTLPIAVAIAAHAGGRLFQEVEIQMTSRLKGVISNPKL